MTRACNATIVSTLAINPPSPSLIVFNHETICSKGQLINHVKVKFATFYDLYFLLKLRAYFQCCPKWTLKETKTVLGAVLCTIKVPLRRK